jgi:hypothetical protein
VADPAVIHDDLELFLIGWYREALAARPEPVCQDVEVDIVEPADGVFPEKLLVIRDDGGPTTSLLTAERAVGMSVLAGSKTAPKDANDLIRIVAALANQVPSPNQTGNEPRNPVAALVDINGPLKVAENQDRSRRYITVTYVVTADAL